MSERLSFGDFVLDAGQQRLWRRDGSEVSLRPQLLAALKFFVDHPGELLDHETLLHALWPGLVVEQNNLNQIVSSLRRALGEDNGRRRYIQTVPRRGFRFVAPTQRLTDAVAAAAEHPSAARASLAATLAVLPFVPLNAETRDSLLEIGMADSLISRLSTVRGLVVRSVGSVLRFAGADQDPFQAAELLNVAWLVDGSLQRHGNSLRVAARLLAVGSGAAVWSGRFDEALGEVFEVQDAISERVAQVLAQKLMELQEARGGELLSRSVAGGTRDADAYQLYLAARQHAQSVRADGLKRSLDLYDDALALDPDYALAHVGRAESYRRMVFGADGEPEKVFAPYRRAVARALELAPDLAEAHAQVGWIRNWSDFDWPAAEAAFGRALALNPNAANGHFGLGFLLLTLGRAEEGLSHVRWARELDPMSLILNTMEAAFLLGLKRRDEALARLRRAFQIEPNFWVAHMVQAMSDLEDGLPGAAIEALRRADARSDRSTQPAALLGVYLARLGRREEARALLQRLQEMRATRYVPPTSFAAIHSALGNAGAALDTLEQAYAVRDTRLIYMKDDPRWQELRGNTRFAELLRRMKLDGLGPGVAGP